MPPARQNRLLSFLSRIGAVESTPLGPDATLVTGRGRGLAVEALDKRTWLVQRPGRGRRTALRLGPPRMRTHLVVDEKTARREPPLHHKRLSDRMALEHRRWILRELGINCVLDVGANAGQFAARLRESGYRGRIVSFEPLPHLVEQLRRRAEGDPDWQVQGWALGDEDTEAEITVANGGAHMSSFLPASAFGKGWSPLIEGVGTVSVPVRRLETVFDEVTAGLDDPRVFLKMDTQGYDLRTFAGAGGRIKEVLGLQSEVACLPIYDHMPRMPEALTTYEAEGFEVTGMYPVNRDRHTPRVIEYDVVMIRAEAVVR